MYRESESNDETVEAALFRDIGAMALREAQVSDVTTMPSAPSPVHEAGRIEGSSSLIRNGRIAGSPGLEGARQRRSAGSGARSEPRAQTGPSSEVDRSTRSTSAQPLRNARLYRCDG